MVKPQIKKFRKSGSPGKKQLNWLWGQQSVLETLQAGRWRVYELFVSNDFYEQHSDLLKARQAEGIELEVVSKENLSNVAQTTEHQGIVARVSKYPYQSIENIETALGTVDKTGASKPLVVIIDRVQDTFSFASILQSCESAGATAVIVGEYCQTLVTTQVARLSSGAVNHLEIFQCPDLPSIAKRVQELGFSFLVHDSKSHQPVCDAGLNGPMALVIGSEVHGVDPALEGICNLHVNIPMSNPSVELNPSIATGILLYEIRRQQRQSQYID